jgi:hypothetical protein
MKLPSDIDRIEFTNGDCVSRCDSIWVGSLGDYTTTYDSIDEFLEDRQAGVGQIFKWFHRRCLIPFKSYRTVTKRRK